MFYTILKQLAIHFKIKELADHQ